VSRLLRRTAVGIVLGVLLYVAVSAWLGFDQLGGALSGFDWRMLAAALGLSTLNYLLRCWKWELCLGWLGVRGDRPGDAPNLSRSRSLHVYIAGLSMSVTPGKIGEVLRSLLLRASDGVAFSRTAPIVVADRLTDVIALVVLSLVGISNVPAYIPHALASLALVVLGVVVLGTPRLFGGVLRVLSRLPLVGAPLGRAGAMVESAARLMRTSSLLALSLLSLAGWGLECVGYWLILHGFAGVEAGIGSCVFLWSITTLVGALSFLPGGLGASEASLAMLVGRLTVGVTQPIALASTLLIRAATLWWGELVGALALALFMRDAGVRERARRESDSLLEGSGGDSAAKPRFDAPLP
jgi:uncharacterized membrane protein YbhN (UPF0104 family)